MRSKAMRVLDVATSAAALIVLAIFLVGAISRPRAPVPAVAEARSETTVTDSVEQKRAEMLQRLAEDAHTLGPPDARAQLVVFGTYGCGHCVRFMEELEVVMSRFPDQVALIYRHNEGKPGPLNVGYRLALGAECAADEGRFHEFNRAAYRLHPGVATNSVLLRLAGDVGIRDPARLVKCVEEKKYAARLASDDSLAKELGFQGTPFWFLNGVPRLGAPAPGELETMIVRAFDLKTERAKKLNPFGKRP